MLTQFFHRLRRFPYTLTSAAGLSLVAWMTNTHLGSISNLWLNRLGFAANDLWLGRLERLFTSAVVTQGGTAFWEALGMTALSTGLAERLAGTRRAVATFWGVHVLTLLAEAWLFSGVIQRWGSSTVDELAWTRDVGPSAGYFGCLGLASAYLPGRWRWLGGLAGMAVLSAALFLPARNGESPAVKFAADLAHLIAFPLGWLSIFIGSRKENSNRRVQ